MGFFQHLASLFNLDELPVRHNGFHVCEFTRRKFLASGADVARIAFNRAFAVDGLSESERKLMLPNAALSGKD